MINQHKVAHNCEAKEKLYNLFNSDGKILLNLIKITGRLSVERQINSATFYTEMKPGLAAKILH